MAGRSRPSDLAGCAVLMAGSALAQAPGVAGRRWRHPPLWRYGAAFVGESMRRSSDRPVPTAGRRERWPLTILRALSTMAWSYAPQTRDYTVQESNAMIGVFGVHAHDCMKAWEWRTRRLPPGQ